MARQRIDWEFTNSATSLLRRRKVDASWQRARIGAAILTVILVLMAVQQLEASPSEGARAIVAHAPP